MLLPGGARPDFVRSAPFRAISAFRNLLDYQSTRTADTFTPCPISRNLKLPPAPFSPGSGSPRWSLCMATPTNFKLGLLPERRMDWRTLATSYGFVILVIVLLINTGFIWPERLLLAQKYH